MAGRGIILLPLHLHLQVLTLYIMPEFTLLNSVFSANAVTSYQKEILKSNTKDNEIFLSK